MSGAYKWKKLSECNIYDPFFDSLKDDYPEFEEWFLKKAQNGDSAFTYSDDSGLGAFIMLKYDECEEIECMNGTKLPMRKRLKISTLKLANHVQGNRLGEGAIGIALWKWMESDDDEIYVTVFQKHYKLIDMLGKFGFSSVSKNKRGELILLKSKNNIDFSTPYTSFPFVSRAQKEVTLLPIEAEWHDKLFPYSELKNTVQETEEFAAANGITKTYICFPYSEPSYKENQPIMIYRKAKEIQNRTYKSVITSYGTIARFFKIKQDGFAFKSFEDFKQIVGNKSVFSDDEIDTFYSRQKNLYVIELVYNHAFGAGNNVNHHTLKEMDIWKECHPFQAIYTMDEFKMILDLANQPKNKLIL